MFLHTPSVIKFNLQVKTFFRKKCFNENYFYLSNIFGTFRKEVSTEKYSDKNEKKKI